MVFASLRVSMQKDFDTELAAVRPRVLALARKFIRASGLRTDAEDIVQEVLLRLWTALNGGAEVLNAEAWASRVTRNLCVSLLRRERGQGGAAPLPASLPAPETASGALDAEEDRRRIERALARIPAGTRRLLELRAAGMSLDEIAAVTARPKGSVKSALSSARKQIINEFYKAS